MHARRDVPEPLARLAALQAGVVSTEQALGLGLTEAMLVRLHRTGDWARLTGGVHLTTAGPPSWTALAWAGVLLGGDGSHLGPEASLHLYRLGPAPDPVDVLVPGRVRPDRDHWTFRSSTPGLRQRAVGRTASADRGRRGAGPRRRPRRGRGDRSRGARRR